MTNLRIIRVNELLKRVIGDYLLKHYASESMSITITRVTASDNLKVADVYFSVYQIEQKEQALKFLIKLRKSIQDAIGKEVRMKQTPRLSFVWDKELQKAHRTFALLQEIDRSLPESAPTIPGSTLF